jgi:hypothetical protein
MELQLFYKGENSMHVVNLEGNFVEVQKDDVYPIPYQLLQRVEIDRIAKIIK